MIIKHVKLYCANLDELKYFYTRKFKFEAVEASNEKITLKVGNSLLTFTENRLQNPYYHFAFNIPYVKVDEALKWVKKKVDILHYKDKEMHDFSSWNARAFYFLDPAGNVVEFIGREKLQSEEEEYSEGFNEKSVLHISEMGIPVFQVSSVANMIRKETGMDEFDNKDSTFCAIGDHRGLFIVVDKAEKTWFPGDAQARAFSLEVQFEEKEKKFRLRLEPGDHIQVLEDKSKP